MDKHPTQLSDEELDAALEEMLAETPPEEVEEEKPTKPETPLADPAEDAKPFEEEEEKPKPETKKEEVEEEKVPSRREQLRIQNLLRKYGDPEVKPVPKEEPKADGLLDLDKDLDADDALKDRLKADRQAAANAAAEQARQEAGVSTQQLEASILFRTRLEVDAPKVEAQYPFLDKNSPKFNPVLAHAMNSDYLERVGFDPTTNTVKYPNVRYTDFIEAQLELADEIAQSRVETTEKEVKKQAAQTGLRPGGQTPTKLNLNKHPSQMSDEELDAAIAQGLSFK